jgi:uncharacterized protein (TIGR00730 family)
MAAKGWYKLVILEKILSITSKTILVKRKKMALRRICVYSGSNVGRRQEYQQAARDLGKELVARNIDLVYGGGRVGLMGVIADTVLSEGGAVIGVMPKALFPREVAHTHLTQLHEVGSMHERKALMADLADGFIALPGGFGTYDELFEIITWSQLGLHSKPVGLLNVAGFFTPLLALITHACTESFIAPAHLHIVLSKDTPVALLDCLTTYQPLPRQARWADPPSR